MKEICTGSTSTELKYETLKENKCISKIHYKKTKMEKVNKIQLPQLYVNVFLLLMMKKFTHPRSFSLYLRK